MIVTTAGLTRAATATMTEFGSARTGSPAGAADGDPSGAPTDASGPPEPDGADGALELSPGAADSVADEADGEAEGSALADGEGGARSADAGRATGRSSSDRSIVTVATEAMSADASVATRSRPIPIPRGPAGGPGRNGSIGQGSPPDMRRS